MELCMFFIRWRNDVIFYNSTFEYTRKISIPSVSIICWLRECLRAYSARCESGITDAKGWNWRTTSLRPSEKTHSAICFMPSYLQFHKTLAKLRCFHPDRAKCTLFLEIRSGTARPRSAWVAVWQFKDAYYCNQNWRRVNTSSRPTLLENYCHGLQMIFTIT